MPRGKKRATKRTYKRFGKRRNRGNFVRNVKAVISSLTEDKYAYTTSGNSLIKFNSGIDTTGDVQAIIPAISQGTGDNNRIGDQIRGKTLTISGHVKLDVNEVNDSTKLPNVAVRMMIVSIKNRPSYDQVTATAAPFATLLKKGGNTVGFTGLLSDLHAPINRDVFTVHHDKKFYLRQDYINAIGPSVPSQYVAQDVSKTVKFFKLKVPCKKIMKYDEDVASGLWPVNYCPFIIMGYTYLSGETPDVVDSKVGLCYDAMFTYEDA